jgi:hypothetical protein
MSEIDDKFYERADKHIDLSNTQLSTASIGKVSASMMYGLARFNSWVSACAFDNAKEMQESKEATIKYFVSEYKDMLTEHLEDYIKNFDKYMK